MADIQTMLNAAYDAYEKAKADTMALKQVVQKLTEENAKLRQDLQSKPKKKGWGKKGNTE